MFPILFEFPKWIPLIGGHALHTYGLMVAVAFLSGMLWVRFEAKRLGIDPQKMMDLFFYVVVSAIVGSRLLYVFASVPRWWMDPAVFFRIWEGGLVFYGGLIGAVLVSVWYCRRHRFSFLTVADVFTPGIALGHVFGRLGCFAAGCCYGLKAPVGSFWSVVFPYNSAGIAPANVPLYPVQLFESFGELVIFAVLFLFRKKKKFEGEVFVLYLTLYPVLRTILEFFRGDKIRGFIIEGMLSTSQFISMIWFTIALALWTTLRRRKTV
ncbi:MAG: prolipoprotein diacylglyceryl transferase [Deltaproteobacteria bacterium]|nr:prolipoprotein diacylglyceryl transferase [Deltaproteobacteria bacterium]